MEILENYASRIFCDQPPTVVRLTRVTSGFDGIFFPTYLYRFFTFSIRAIPDNVRFQFGQLSRLAAHVGFRLTYDSLAKI